MKRSEATSSSASTSTSKYCCQHIVLRAIPSPLHRVKFVCCKWSGSISITYGCVSNHKGIAYLRTRFPEIRFVPFAVFMPTRPNSFCTRPAASGDNFKLFSRRSSGYDHFLLITIGDGAAGVHGHSLNKSLVGSRRV
ncbi:unnamed protein product [Ceratitis capitata]|uniref:(Mediterranean fruit fly) hypothetical protein n=1 Tax=Ceratitis capitata TaxID=7213 RepID=A0A811TYE1_CERCA|nr:unnamed protein product [Ceratitis capitata]